jgi:DNA-binding SARP family transcriptional activator
MDFGILGPLTVADRGAPFPVTPRKPRIVLAVLLCRPNTTVSADRLIDALWGEQVSPTASNTLHVHVHRLRQALGPAGRDRVEFRAPGYLVAVCPGELDAQVFNDLADEGHRAYAARQYMACSDILRRALSLWRAAPFADLPGVDALREDAAWLEERCIGVLGQRIDADLALGRHAELIAELSELAARHPFRERFAAQLMLALYRAGRQAEALDVYRRTREQLRENLGLNPGRELRRLEQAILTADGGLDLHAGGRATPTRAPALGVRQAPGVPVCQLPRDTPDLTGRTEQVSRLCRLLTGDSGTTSRGVAIASVAGMGGVGKTALAVHVAHRLRERFPDGQLFVDLHGAGSPPADPAHVLGAFLMALGADASALPTDLEDRAAMYRGHLTDRKVLVVLDNAATEAQVLPLLPGSPGCAVLITSRSPLTGLPGALLVDLAAFQPDEAMELLRRVVGRTRIDAEPAAAAEMVRLCGYLPLAVRIAGARLAARPHWTLVHLADRLRREQQRLDELSSGDVTVRTSMGMSYGALRPETRRALRLLALLDPPDFAAWVPAAVLDITVDAAETHLDALIDAQLVTCTEPDVCGQDRYQLHDLVRLYARERSREEDDAAQCREALVRALGAWLALAEAADSGLAERVAADVRGAALRWYPQPTRSQTLLDPVAWFDCERVALTTCVAQACRAGLDELAWELSARAVNFFAFRGLYDEWLRTHELALRACIRARNRLGEATMLRNLGCLRMTGVRASSGPVMARAEAALRTFQERGERQAEVDVLELIAFAHLRRGAVDESLVLAGRAMAAAKATGYELGQCRLWYLHAVTSREQGCHDEAVRYAEQSLRLAERIGSAHDRVLALWELAASCCDRRSMHRISNHLCEGVELCQRRGERLLEAYLLLSLGTLYLRFGKSGARRIIQEALSVFRDRGVLFGEAVGLRLLGELDHADGQYPQAVAHLTQAVQVVRAIGDVHEQALALKALSEVCRTAGDRKGARRAREEARALFERLGNKLEAAAVGRAAPSWFRFL